MIITMFKVIMNESPAHHTTRLFLSYAVGNFFRQIQFLDTALNLSLCVSHIAREEEKAF